MPIEITGFTLMLNGRDFSADIIFEDNKFVRVAPDPYLGQFTFKGVSNRDKWRVLGAIANTIDRIEEGGKL